MLVNKLSKKYQDQIVDDTIDAYEYDISEQVTVNCDSFGNETGSLYQWVMQTYD